MSENEDFGGLGRQYLQTDSYGIAAFCFYRAVIDGTANGNPWNGLVLALSLMRREHDAQVVLARYGLTVALPFDKDLVPIGTMLFQHSPVALSAWLRSHTHREGIEPQDKQTLAALADDVERSYAAWLEQYGDRPRQENETRTLQEWASLPMELDWITAEPLDKVFEIVQNWLADPEYALNAIRALSMIPDARSEKLLRRAARNEEIDDKVRTHAVLALRWLGLRGNAKLNKYGESFVIDLDDPKPELTVSVPVAYKPVLDRLKLWLAKQQGVIDEATYEAHASTDEHELPEELSAQADRAEVPAVLQEVAHALIRAAYDKYYPLVPTIRGTRQWSAALLLLLKDYTVGLGEQWPYGEPEQDETAVQHRNWLLSASPHFYDEIDARRQQRA